MLTGLLMAAAIGGVATSPAWSAPVETTLYNFKGNHDGAGPLGTLLRDKTGALYGTTSSGGSTASDGAVFKLTLVNGNWTETVLHRFAGGSDGQNPDGGLVMGSDGSLYGTAQWGGIDYNGIVFRLTPPPAGTAAWQETVLYRFNKTEPENPTAGLVIDAAGALYGTTCGCGLGDSFTRGSVFKLTPPKTGTAWTETVLHEFTGNADGGLPHAGLARDAAGVLYGTAQSGGTHHVGVVYQVAPPAKAGGKWVEKVLYNFGDGSGGGLPFSGVTLDAQGALYGTTQNGGVKPDTNGFGTVYKLTPGTGGKPWTETVLYRFKGEADGNQPGTAPVIGSGGALYGTTNFGGDQVDCPAGMDTPAGCGVVYKLAPPTSGTRWTESVLHAFAGQKDGSTPWAGVIVSGGAVYGTTELGGKAGFGTVFMVK